MVGNVTWLRSLANSLSYSYSIKYVLNITNYLKRLLAYIQNESKRLKHDYKNYCINLYTQPRAQQPWEERSLKVLMDIKLCQKMFKALIEQLQPR